MRFFFSLGSFSFSIQIGESTHKLVIDETTFKECVSKIGEIRTKKPPKRRKVLVHFKNGKFILKEL